MILREDKGPFALLRLQHGKVSAIDVELCQSLSETLAELEVSPVKAVVLTGTGNTFSAGVDLFRLVESGRDYVREFVPKLSDALKQFFIFPKPIIAAVNGHAIAGGCILACACDYRIAATGNGKIGVPEGLVGVPFPPVAFEILRFATDHRRLQEIVYFGRYYHMEEGVQLGLIDETISPDQLLIRATEIAEKLAAIPANTFQLIKRQLREPYLRNIERSKIRDAEMLKVWTSEETQAVVRDYLGRTVKKS